MVGRKRRENWDDSKKNETLAAVSLFHDMNIPDAPNNWSPWLLKEVAERSVSS